MRGSWMVITLACALLGCAGSNAVCPEPPPSPAPQVKEQTMRTYFMGFLRRGPKWTAEKTPESSAAFEGHMAHIDKLAATGQLLIAGPFEVPDGAPRDALAGIFLFDVPTIEEAIALTKEDPAVKVGRFSIEVMSWYGPSGLTYDGHKKAADPKAADPATADPAKKPEAPAKAH